MSVKAVSGRVDSAPPSIPKTLSSDAVPWPPPPTYSPAEPLSTRSIHAQEKADPAITQVFKTTLGVNLGHNCVVPIALRPEQQTKFQTLLDTVSEQFKKELTCYLAVKDTHGKWKPGEEHVTWFRYNPSSRSIEYQIHNEEKIYHISLKTIEADHEASTDFDRANLIGASSQLEKTLSEITGITIKHITYQEGSVTLFTGRPPFDKSTSPALKSLADKSFEQALDVVKQQLTRKDTMETAEKNFKALKEALESEKAEAVRDGQDATAQMLEGVIQELDTMDGFAVGIAASSQLKPKDYTSALKLNEEIYQSVCDRLRVIEENREASVGENISRAWQGWTDPAAKAVREQERRIAAKQYAVDVASLCLDHEMTPETSAELQAASLEIHLSTRTSESTQSLEHQLYTYLITRNTDKLETFLTHRFADPADPTDHVGAFLAKKICDELAPLPAQVDDGLIDEMEEEGAEPPSFDSSPDSAQTGVEGDLP